MAALPAQAVIQYDQALVKPVAFPKADAGVGVRPAVSGQAPRQRGEQDREREGADRRQRHREQADRPVVRE